MKDTQNLKWWCDRGGICTYELNPLPFKGSLQMLFGDKCVRKVNLIDFDYSDINKINKSMKYVKRTNFNGAVWIAVAKENVVEPPRYSDILIQ